MKKMIFIFILIITSVSFSYSQKVNDPMIIKNELKKTYPNAENLRWDVEPGSYKATFDENGSQYIVDFDEKGVINSVTTRLKEEDIPADINMYVLKLHPDERFKEVDKIVEKDGKVSYSMKVKNNEYLFDQDYKHLNTNNSDER